MFGSSRHGQSSMLQPVDELAANSVEVIPNQLYACPVRRLDGVRLSPTARQHLAFCIDEELIYEPFFADFGPLNLGQCYRYCARLDMLLREARSKGIRVYHVMSADPHYRANSAVLLGWYLVLFENKTAEDAFSVVGALKPFAPFRDASCGPSTYNLSVLDSIRAMQKAMTCGLVDIQLREKASFNVDEYEYYERVENGDMNWTVPGRFLAFSGPSSKRTEFYGYRTMVPEDYVPYFKSAGITAVVRLNKKMYDRRRFTDSGIRHYDLYFPDGSCPSDAILRRFLEATEAEHAAGGACAVHCKAGLGRTGVLVGCYIMKHFRFTAAETIAYLRTCRPGSVIGPQQQYLCDMEQRMWREGDAMRSEAAVRGGLPGGGIDNMDSQMSDASYTSPVKSMRSGTTPSIYSPINMRGGPDGRVPSGSGMAAVQALQASGAAGAAAAAGQQGMPRSRGYAAPYQHRDVYPLRTQVAASQPDMRHYAGASSSGTPTDGRRTTPNGRHALAATMTTDTLSNATKQSPLPVAVPTSKYGGRSNNAIPSMLPPNASPNVRGTQGSLNRVGMGSPSAAVIQRVVAANGQPRKVVVPAQGTNQPGMYQSGGGHIGSVATRYDTVGAPASQYQRR
ncbi:cell division cycle 14 [Pycnococcus provasolii]